jgi:uncharacterized protein
MLARLLSWFRPARPVPADAPAQAGSPMPSEWHPQGPRMDGPIANEWTGVGTIRSKLEATRPGMPIDLTDDELDALNVSPLARVIHHPAEQAMTRGYRVDADGQRDVAGQVDEAIDMRRTLARWLVTGRGGRGAHIMIVDGSTDWSQPIKRGIGIGGSGVLRLQVIDHREAVALDADPDPASPGWTLPLHWHVTVRRDGVAQVIGKVHASRLVTHFGVAGLPSAMRAPSTPRAYGYSMWHLYWPAVRRLWSTSATGEAAGVELTSPWIKLGSLAAFVGDRAAKALVAMTSIARGRSSHGITVLGPDDEMGRDSLSLSGYSELTAGAWSDVAAVEGYPLTRLIGQAPAGLSTDDESGHQTWAMLLDTMSAQMERAGRQIHDVILGDGRRTWVWGPVRVPSDLDMAQADLVRVQAGQTRIQAGISLPEHEAARYQGPEVLPDPVIPADWRGAMAQGTEGAAAVVVTLVSEGIITQATASAILRRQGLDVPDVVPAAEIPDQGAAVNPATPDTPVDTALNGAQVSAAVDIVAQVGAGTLPRGTGLALLVELFGVEPGAADRIMGEVGRGFTPAAPIAPAAGNTSPTPMG